MKYLRCVLVLGVATLFAAVTPNIHALIHTVTTVDNASTPDDGRLSLLEAIQQSGRGDTIRFQIPGDGPHLIQTPLGGYPFIQADDLVIDGFTQPGSKPSAAGFAGLGDMKIQIFLDSTASDEGPGIHPEKSELVSRRSTRMLFADGRDIPGYGDSENGILSILDADRVTLRGLGFLGRHTPGNSGDPAIYGIALARGATRVKVQGCWFGLRPDGLKVEGFRAAVAAFRHRVKNEAGQDVDTFSERLVFGVDGDGIQDAGEGNIAVGMELALALELNDLRVSGNYFNLFPDGRTFLDIDTYAAEHQLGTMETIENGRSRQNMLIGTDGDGVSDALERNVFSPSRYKHCIEVYGGNPATNMVIAGNHYGVAADGVTSYPHAFLAQPDFLFVNGVGSVRVGSNGDGRSDLVEANLIQGISGVRFLNGGNDLPVVVRGNQVKSCGFLGVPFAQLQDQRDYVKYLEPVLGVVDNVAAVVPVLTDMFGGFLNGSLPLGLAESYPHAWIDLYERDVETVGAGLVQPGRWLGRWVEGSTQDLDARPGYFSFGLGALSVAADRQWVAQVTYSKTGSSAEPGSAITGPLSEPLSIASQPGVDPGKVPRVVSGRAFLDDDLLLGWVGARGLWLLESAESLSGPWAAWTGGFQYVEGAPRGSGHYEVRVDPGLEGRKFFRIRSSYTP